MSRDVEKEFEDLAQEVSTSAAGIVCSTSEYIDGLNTIIGTLETDLRAAEETAP